MLRIIIVALAGASCLSLAMTPAAFAQTQPPVASESAAPDVSDIGPETRRAFAVAYLDVRRVVQANRDRLAEAENPAEQQKIMQDVNSQVIRVVDDTPGISPNEYSAIADAVSTDPELVEELNGYVQELSRPAAQ